MIDDESGESMEPMEEVPLIDVLSPQHARPLEFTAD